MRDHFVLRELCRGGVEHGHIGTRCRENRCLLTTRGCEAENALRANVR